MAKATKANASKKAPKAVKEEVKAPVAEVKDTVKEAAVKATPAKAAEAKKTETKAAPAKAAEVMKTETKAAPAKAAETKKTETKAAPAKAAEKDPEVKAEPAKTPAKKAAPKAKAEAKVEVAIEYAGGQEAVADIVENVKKVLAGNGVKDAKEIKIFVKPEDKKAYIVADGENYEMDVNF